ncbi:aminoglycoside phosphotransferase family protein [Streptomyces sp. NPDC002787]
MSSQGKLHADEFDIDEALVRRLIAAQFPEWAGLPLAPAPTAGTDNVMYHLGDDMVVRLPRRPDGAHHADKEHRWLPLLAPHLPLAVPEPLAKGRPSEAYGLSWSVLRWLDGENAHDAPVTDLGCAAEELGRFVAALRKVDATGGPVSFRGGPVAAEDDEVRDAIRGLGADGAVDAALATAVWEETLRVPQWTGDPVWVHADLLPGNLLTTAGRLTAVIDFGGLGVGDPACDLLPAWALCTADSRATFRETADVDVATWARGRGWALCFGLVAEHYYRDKGHVLAEVGRRTAGEVLAEYV